MTRMKPTKTQSSSPTWNRRIGVALQLKWLAPFWLFPHGLTGAIALLLGLQLTVSSLLNSHEWLIHTRALQAYAASAFVNAASGIVIADRAPPKFRVAFRVSCLQQIGLIWFTFRFRPSALEYRIPFGHEIDLLMLLGILFAWSVYIHLSLTFIRKDLGVAVAAGVLCGVVAQAPVLVYPAQLALGGDEWLRCVVDTYPMQLVGLSGYVYVPITWMFAAMLFGATLLNRKVITGVEFGLIFGVGCVGIVVLTVLVQEVHMPFVNTQRLLIPCPPPPPGSRLEAIADALDLSALSQKFLGRFGFEF